MARDCIISQRSLQAQADVFRIACDPLRYGETLTSLSTKSGIPYSTLRSYAGHNGEPAEMPLSAIRKLQRAQFPNELLSLLLEAGTAIVQVPDGIDHDELAALFCDYLRTKEAAHHPESEAGREIGPNEHATLNSKVVQLKKVAA